MIVVNVNRIVLSCKTESCAVKSKLAGLEISTEVAAKLDVLKAVNTSSESRCNANSTGDNAERLRHCQEKG
jgi:hypothetical protein